MPSSRMRNGIGISEITLWLFGGLAHMQRDSDSAGVEFRVAAAGPAVTLLIAIAATAIGIGLAGSEQGFFDAMVVSDDADVSGVLAVIAWLGEPERHRPHLQPHPGVPARRRAHPARDRVAPHRRPQPGDPLRSADRPGLLLPLHRGRRRHRDGDRRRDLRHLARLGRLPPRLRRARDRQAHRGREPHRRSERRRRDGRRAGLDRGRHHRRAGARRVLPSVSLAVVSRD